MKIVIGISIVILIALIAITIISAETADARQAQAAIEAARAAQIAAAGQAQTSFTQGIVIVLLIVALLTAIGLVGWLFYQFRIKPVLDTMNGTAPGGVRVQGAQRRQVSGSQAPALSAGDAINQLVQLELLRTLRGMNQRQNQLPPAYYQQTLPDDVDDDWGADE